MAPFPETEIMTIKRLEVALRKMDFKLLKDGAYKLHEKYHGGFKFQYLDLLKEIFLEVSNNDSIPTEIKDILNPTIEDILSSQGIDTDTSTSPFDSANQNRVSSLTSLSYSTEQANNFPEQKINAFEAFSPKTQETTVNSYSNSSVSTEPFKEFSSPSQQYIAQNQPPQENSQNVDLDNNQNQNEMAESKNIVETKTKTIAIYYGQDNSTDKTKNIIKYKKLVFDDENTHSSINEVMSLLCEINTQSDTNVSELKNLFEQLKSTIHKLNLITNVSSKNLISLFEENNLSYTFLNNSETAQTKLIPLFGLSNLFVCKECNEKYLNKENNISSLVFECPKCKKPMFPELYVNNGKGEINFEYYNEAFIQLASSDVWFIVHPSFNEKIVTELLSSALKLNNKIKEIFILDKDINIRENFRNLFLAINSELKVNTQITALEDFLNLVR